MPLKMRKKIFFKSFTLAEVLVGAVILAASYGALLASFMGARKYVLHANKRIVAANLARNILNDLSNKLGQDTWESNFSGGTHNLSSVTIDEITYQRSYEVTDVTNRDYRQVTVTIQYPED